MQDKGNAWSLENDLLMRGNTWAKPYKDPSLPPRQYPQPCRKQGTRRGKVVSSNWKDGVGILGTLRWLEFIRQSAKKEMVTNRENSTDLQKGPHYPLLNPRWELTKAWMWGNHLRLGGTGERDSCSMSQSSQMARNGRLFSPTREKTLILHRHWTELSSQIKTRSDKKNYMQIL